MNKTNTRFQEAQEHCISVQALYEKYGDDMNYCRIEESDNNYFDLYNDDGELACMDGENCRVCQVGAVLVTFSNSNGDGTLHFTLTHDEAETACFSHVKVGDPA